MDYQSFIEQFSTAAIDEAKVAKVEEVYGVELPEEVKHYVSACGREPITVVDGDDELLEAFSIGTILDAESPMVTDCIEKNMIALAYCYDNDFLVYMFDDDTWDMYNPQKRECCCESESLEDFVDNVFFSEDDDEEDEEDDEEEDLQTKVSKALAGLNLPEGSFKMMDIFEAAEAGIPNAQFQVGMRYQDGDGVEQSDETAFEWFSKAAENGYADAQYSAGRCYLLGCGVEQNVAKGLELFTKAAEKGNGGAQYFLGLFYQNGEAGLEPNDEVAFEWYKKAAENGCDDAKLELGRYYEAGEVVEQDLNLAAKYYKEALDAGVDGADDALDDLKDTMAEHRSELIDNIKGKKVVDVADFIELLNIYREEGVDFLWSMKNFKVLHGCELLRIAEASSFEKDVLLLEKDDVYSGFKKELSDEEFNSYDYYLVNGQLPTQFAIKKLK